MTEISLSPVSLFTTVEGKRVRKTQIETSSLEHRNPTHNRPSSATTLLAPMPSLVVLLAATLSYPNGAPQQAVLQQAVLQQAVLQSSSTTKQSGTFIKKDASFSCAALSPAAAAMNCLIDYMKTNYAFSAWKKINWNDVFETARPYLSQADAVDSVAAKANLMADALHESIGTHVPDGHLSFRFGDNVVTTAKLSRAGSFGFTLAKNTESRLVVTAVDPKSSAAAHGVTVGWELIDPSCCMTSAYRHFDDLSAQTANRERDSIGLLTRAPVGTERTFRFSGNGSKVAEKRSKMRSNDDKKWRPRARPRGAALADDDDDDDEGTGSGEDGSGEDGSGEDGDEHGDAPAPTNKPTSNIPSDSHFPSLTLTAYKDSERMLATTVRSKAPRYLPGSPWLGTYTWQGGRYRTNVLWARVPNSTFGYLQIVSEMGAEKFKAALKKAFTAFSDTDGLIIDIRRNEGGQDDLAAWIEAALSKPSDTNHFYEFITKSREWLVAKNSSDANKMINGTYTGPAGYVAVEEHGKSSTKARSLYTKPIVMITDRFCLSSGEGVARACKRNPRCKLVGFEGTHGSFGMTDGVVELSKGVKLGFPNGQSLSYNGTIQLDSKPDATGAYTGGVPLDVTFSPTTENLIARAAYDLARFDAYPESNSSAWVKTADDTGADTGFDVELDLAKKELQKMVDAAMA